MRFSLDVVRARKGDCLLLHYGTATTPRLMLIDGGPSGVYTPHLRPRLERIRRARQLDDRTPLPIDVLMISHVDDDHIQGVLELTSELREQKMNRQPLLVRVQSLWHNTFDDLLDTTPRELDAAASFGAAALSGAVDIDGAEDVDAARVLASIPQGRLLRDDAKFLADGTRTWTVNDRFGGRLILARKGAKRVTLARGVTATVAGPMHDELAALQKAHDQWLRERRQRKVKRAESSLAAFLDKSVPNLSSLVMMVQAGDRRVLLTGDARGDKVMAGLQMAGLLAPGETSSMHVDVMKVPHHGSANNVDRSFFTRITADHYVLSGNGEHGNPERDTLEMLFAARRNEPFVVHFTYPIDEIDAARKIDWAKERVKEKKRGKKPRPAWSPARHALASFFAGLTLASGQKIVTTESGDEPHVIDLLDPLGI
jgi:hypothetical protein